MASAPPLRRREVAAAAAGACVLAALMHWPLPLHLGSDVPRDLGDPLTQAWQVAWGGHALTHQPLDWFQANMFWPLPNSLAFSDALVGYAPAGAVGEGFTAAVARYDLLFLFAYALAFLGAYLLARELGARPAGAAVAGAAFAYAPWRLEQDGHLHVLSSGGIPLSLFLLARGYRRGSARTVLAGWAVAAWQVSLGFTLGLQLAYLLLALGVGVAVLVARGRLPRPSRRVAVATLAGGATVAATALVLALPYLEVRDDHPESRRTAADVAAFSGPPRMFVVAPAANLVWGKATAGQRERLDFVPEQTLFPGLAILLLAGVGLAGGAYRRRLRAGLAVGTLAVAVLSLGFPRADSGWLHPYRALYDLAPGWQAVRVPGRLHTLTTLGLALLAAGGTHRLVGAAPRRLGTAAAAGLVAAVLVEGSGFDLGDGVSGPAHPTVPRPPPGQRAAPAPQLHLPAGAFDNRRYLIWSTDGFPDLVNGRGSFIPTSFLRLVRDVEGFPDRASVARLRRLGVRSVVLHPGPARRSPWRAWRRRDVAGLGVRRTVAGGVVVYRLTPG